MPIMDSTTDNTKTAPIQHPDWCYSGWCSVYRTDAGYATGDHLRLVRTMPKCEGGRLHVFVNAEASVMDGACINDELRVTLIEPLSEDFDVPAGEVDNSDTRIRLGDRTALEPEEARMLARFLLLAADELEQIRG